MPSTLPSAREKSIRHGHPSTLHLWWARRPLAAARAVIFAQMVDDPSSFPDLFPTEKAQEKERERLFEIIEELVKWENTTNETVLQKARDEIWQSWRRACAENADHPRARELFDRHKLPAFHDPFAGGGALPLEAQRLGLESLRKRPESGGGVDQQSDDRDSAEVRGQAAGESSGDGPNSRGAALEWRRRAGAGRRRTVLRSVDAG